MDVFITVDQRGSDGAFQMSIWASDVGYRIAGPKYDGTNRPILRRKLTKRDADEIRSYLDQIGEEP